MPWVSWHAFGPFEKSPQNVPIIEFDRLSTQTRQPVH